MRATPLAIPEALDGYLSPPGRAGRHVLYLDGIVRHALAGDASMYWSSDLPTDHFGYSHCCRRRLFFRPELVEQPPWLIRDCVSHELGHILFGTRSCERVRTWQADVFGTLIEPEEAVIEHTPDTLDQETLLSLVWERCGLDYPDVEKRADADGVTVRRLCLMLLAGDGRDEWLDAA